MKRLYSLILLASLAFLAGCGTYRLVEVDVATDLNTVADVTTVPHIALRVAKARNIVISYSSEYYDTSDKGKGATVLMRSKGMWITEIEREFVK